MAVAVKTSTDSRQAGAAVSPAIISLVGMVYVVACLAIVFRLIPSYWWPAAEALGWGKSPFVVGAALTVVCVTVMVLLTIVGSRLLGSQMQVGVKAGIFVAFVGALTILLVTRWASQWLEHWSYVDRTYDAATGWTLVGVFGGVLSLLGLFLFSRPWMQQLLVQFEQGGWFSATAYKGSQGQKLRRATVAGLLLVVGSGIYTLLQQGILARGEPNWTLNIPFTGHTTLQSFGDAAKFLEDLPPTDKGSVRIVWEGENTGLTRGRVVPFADYQAAVLAAISETSLVKYKEKLDAASKEPIAFLLAVNRDVLGAKMSELLDSGYYENADTRLLDVQFNQTAWEGVGSLMPTFATQADKMAGKSEGVVTVPAEFRIPSAELVLNRFVMRDVVAQTDKKENVRVGLKWDSNLDEGSIVSRKVFDEEIARLDKERKEGRDRKNPEEVALRAPWGMLEYDSILLLPAVQFTMPLLLLAGSLWLSWRVVNLPSFADFLIATEAEMNKVSWTTQKRLFQDTIVVLTTVLLMAIFLFGMDYTWKIVLSWRPIGVLHIPKETTEKAKSVDQKKW
jgi:preprotein translocase SecE subunit